MGRRALGAAMVLFAAFLVAVGIVEFELVAIAVGSLFGVAGTGTIWWGLKAREDRRRALMARLQRRVLLLATERGGTLTVTEVAALLNMSLSAARACWTAWTTVFASVPTSPMRGSSSTTSPSSVITPGSNRVPPDRLGVSQ